MIPMERFTRQAQEAMARTQAVVAQFGHATVEPEHLLLALLDHAGPVADAVTSLKGDPKAIASQVRAYLNRQPRQGPSGQLFLGRRGKRILDAAIVTEPVRSRTVRVPASLAKIGGNAAGQYLTYNTLQNLNNANTATAAPYIAPTIAPIANPGTLSDPWAVG